MEQVYHNPDFDDLDDEGGADLNLPINDESDIESVGDSDIESVGDINSDNENEDNNNINDLMSNNDEDDDNEDNEDDDDEDYKKFDKNLKKKYLLEQHPESENVNYEEVLVLSKITRDKDGNIVDDLHKTLPILTKYEKTRVLGLRAKQISCGSDIYIKINKDIILPYLIAEMELKEKKLPFIIRRPIPNGSFEYWCVEDLELL